MTVTETLDGLGSWELRLVEGTPDSLLTQLGLYGHVAIVAGPVDVEAAGDGLLTGARYVGVTRAKGKGSDRRLAGSGMVFWLGDEDNKGHVIENEVTLTAQTLAQAVPALLPPTVTLGTIHPGAVGTYTGKHVFQSPRQALTSVCEAFGRELRVNGNASVDFGTQAQLYTAVPDSILVRKGAGADLDLTGLSGQLEVDTDVYDYSTRVVLLGQTVATGDTPAETFATGSANAPVVPYVDLRGNPVKFTRLISESGETQGSVAARSQLQLNRFNRVARSLKISLDDYEIEGNFRVGDMTYVYDPDTEIFDPAREVDFRGELLHPDIVRVSGMTWPVARGMTVAFRTQAGVWLDLTPFVTYETGATEVTIGDLPRTLTRPGDDPIQVRVDAARGDPSIPGPPTNLQLTTDATLNSRGQTIATIGASWTAPATNTDGSVITDLAHYRVEYRPQFRAPTWVPGGVSATTSADLSNLTPDLPYDVRVAAVDKAGNVGPWSTTASITSARDQTAPPAPADPVATTVLGQARIEYTGVTSTGGQMPSDTNRVEFHIGTTAGFTATAATRVNDVNPFAKGVHYATVPYGAAARWVRLVAVDHTGNVSGSSASVPLTASQVVSPDIFDGAVGSAKLADLAVITAKIADLAVNDAKIGSVSVGKLTAGTVTAELVMAGRMTTALTGARREMNAIGFQAWDAANNQTINFDGVNNLLTGTLRTSLTGRRMVLGSAGAMGRIAFLAPDGTEGEIGSFTGVNTGNEAIRAGIVQPTISQLWTKTQWQENGAIQSWSAFHKIAVGGGVGAQGFEVTWAANRGTPTEAIFPEAVRMRIDAASFVYNDASTVRMRMDAGGYTYWDAAGKERLLVGTQASGFLVRDTAAVARLWVRENATTLYGSDAAVRFHSSGTTLSFQPSGNGSEVIVLPGLDTHGSAELQLLAVPLPNNGGRFGAIIKFYDTTGIEIRNVNDTGFEDIYAFSFQEMSDRTLKKNIRDFGGGALAKIRGTTVKRFAMKEDRKARDRMGIIAQEAPDEVTAVGREGLLSVDLGQSIWMLWAGLQEEHAERTADVSELRVKLEEIAAAVDELRGAAA